MTIKEVYRMAPDQYLVKTSIIGSFAIYDEVLYKESPVLLVLNARFGLKIDKADYEFLLLKIQKDFN